MECVNMKSYRPDEDVSRINENVQADSGVWRLASGIWHLASGIWRRRVESSIPDA
jgi:hypothetical protein